MDYEKKYKNALKKFKEYFTPTSDGIIACGISRKLIKDLFPELKESEDEKIRKWLIGYFRQYKEDGMEKYANGLKVESIITWIEKQGTPAKLSEEKQNKFAKSVLTSCALSFINYLDAHKHESKMCVSNGECEDIENAFHNAMWDRLHRYYCKYIEKQGEKEEVDSNKTNNKHQDIMQMLQSIYEVLVSINNKYSPVQVVPYTPQPLTPLYDTSKPYCNNTNKIDDDNK